MGRRSLGFFALMGLMMMITADDYQVPYGKARNESKGWGNTLDLEKGSRDWDTKNEVYDGLVLRDMGMMLFGAILQRLGVWILEYIGYENLWKRVRGRGSIVGIDTDEPSTSLRNRK